MARIGINPARGKISEYRPAKVSLAVLTYIPDLSGYFEHRLEVLQLALASLRAHTTPPYDLLIFDNGSCQTVVDALHKLQTEGKIDYLVFSRNNIGKIGALRLLFEAAPGEIIAYSDEDILFYPGWLPAHLAILESFPNVGMVSGTPVRDAARHACQSLERLRKEIENGRQTAGTSGLSISFERRIPEEWEVDWAESTGRDPQQHLQETSDLKDMVLRVEKPETGERCEAIGSANHFQFVGRKQVLLQVLPTVWSGKLMGHMIELDQAIDDLGYLRLSTVQRYTRHLGNALSHEVLEEAHKHGLMTGSGGGRKIKDKGRGGKRHWALRLPGSRRFLVAAYKRLFDILYR